MPPRARKTTPPAPDEEPEQAQLDEPGEAPGQPTPASAEDTPEPAAAPDTETTAPAQAPSFRWERVAGTLPEPCRECFPGGPAPSVGSAGCSHGQWVRVQDVV